MKKQQKEAKTEKIEYYKGKGLDWCAEQLWNAKEAAQTEREYGKRLRNENYALRHEAEEAKLLKKVNVRIAKLLEENGIRPVRLRITYKDCDCKHCENNGYIYGEDAWDCQGCGEEIDGEIWRNKEITVTETEPFYSYQLSGNKLAGITGTFEANDYSEVIKIVDLSTNEVLFEERKEKQ